MAYLQNHWEGQYADVSLYDAFLIGMVFIYIHIHSDTKFIYGVGVILLVHLVYRLQQVEVGLGVGCQNIEHCRPDGEWNHLHPEGDG